MTRKDEVFQVSLTEIAFTLVILMVLLLGSMLYKAQESLHEKQQEVYKLMQWGGLCSPNPDDPIEPMMPCKNCISRVASISRREADTAVDLGLNIVEQFKARTGRTPGIAEQQMILDLVGRLSSGERLLTGEAAIRAEAVIHENQRLQAKLSSVIQENIQLQEAQEKLSSEHKDLLGNVGKYKMLANVHRNEAPACWVSEETLQYEYLFDILIRDGKYVVRRGKGLENPIRMQEALTIPGVMEMIGAERGLTTAQFRKYSRQVFNYGQQRKPLACRFFVTMRSEIDDRKSADAARFVLEDYFYKYEERK